MRLTIWILEPDPAVAHQLTSAWQTVAGDQVELRLFSSPPAASQDDPPDLLMGEIYTHCDQVTDLLLTLRRYGSIDFLPVTCDTAPSSFTRAQQLGAIDYILKPFTSRRLRQSLRRYLSLKQGLTAGYALTQKQLDLFFFSGSGRKKLPALPFSDAELQFCKRVLSLLASSPEKRYSAEEVAQLTAVSRVTARKYLEKLTEAGYVLRLLVYGQKGRPRNLYQIKGDIL